MRALLVPLCLLIGLVLCVGCTDSSKDKTPEKPDPTIKPSKPDAPPPLPKAPPKDSPTR